MLATLAKKPGLKGAIAVASVFFAFTLILTLNRHFTFYSSYDQGIFNQVFWNGLHGRFFQSSLSSQLSTNVIHSGEVPEVFYHRLGQHFTPALLLWLPLYALFPYPATLTVLQVALVTAAGLVLFALARQYLQPTLSVWLVASFYAANAVLGPTLANFHDSSQIPLFAFGLLLAMEKRWWWLFGILCACILAVREDSGVVLFGVGAYMLASRRFPRIGAAVCAASLAYILLLTNYVMPLFSEDVSRRFVLERFGQYVEGDSATTFDVIVGILSQPWTFVAETLSPLETTLLYMAGQTLPLAFVPLLSPAAWAMAGPPTLQILAAKGTVLSLNLRYAMTVVPGIFYGGILWWSGRGWRRFWPPGAGVQARKLMPKFKRWWTFCLVVSALVCLAHSPNRTLYFVLPDSYQPWVYVSLPEQLQRTQQMNRILRTVPPDASVSATTYLVPHLSGRREIVRFPNLLVRNDDRQVISVDYAMVDLWRMERYQVAFRSDRGGLIQAVGQVEAMLDGGDYGAIAFDNGVILLQRQTPSDPAALEGWRAYRQHLDPILQQVP